MFILLNKLENAPTAPTTKTIERLLVWVDVKGGRFLLVKRAKRSKLDTAPLEREVTSHDINNVQCGCDLLDGFRRNSRHSRVSNNKRCVPDHNRNSTTIARRDFGVTGRMVHRKPPPVAATVR